MRGRWSLLIAAVLAGIAPLPSAQAAAPAGRPGAGKASGPAAAKASIAAAAAAPSAVRGVVTVAGAKTNAGAVVTLEAPGLAPAAPLAQPLKIDQKGFRFLPHVTVLPTGSAVRFLNNDPEPHNVYSPEGPYNLGTWPTGDTRTSSSRSPVCTASSATCIPTCSPTSSWSRRRTSP